MFLEEDMNIDPPKSSVINLAAQQNYVLLSQNAYGSGKATIKKLVDGRRVLIVESETYKLTDEFDGGNPFCGIERLVDKNSEHVIWNGYYHGWLTKASAKSKLSTTDLFNFLREALRTPSKTTILRGPESYTSAKLHYKNKLEFGTFECFFGNEAIYDEKERLLYYGRYGGGVVDLVEDMGEA